VQVFAARGVAGATMQEVALVAGVTPGTVYNHFASKDELAARVALTVGESLSLAIHDSCAQITDAAERMAVGQRRYIWLAAQSPGWTLLLLDVVRASPGVGVSLHRFPTEDLRLGIRQKVFKVPSEAAAIDMIAGIVSTAMQRVALGQAPRNHDVAVATLALRALGVAAELSAEVARRPLPDLLDLPAEGVAGSKSRRPAPKTRR